MAEDFANQERYTLQPKKTEALLFSCRRSKPNTQELDSIHLYDTPIPDVDSATHLGIKRATSLTLTSDNQVESNLDKARKALYSLLATGLHGSDSLDPESTIHLLKTYVLPILTYGLEILQLNKAQMLKIEKFQKKIVKQILRLPQNTGDAAVYILSGLLPIEAIIDRKILTFFYSICLQDSSSVERRLAIRQLTVKTQDSNSWFIGVKQVLWKYDLVEAEDLLEGHLSYTEWKRQASQAINIHWTNKILHSAAYSKSLKYLSKVYTPGKVHPILQTPVKSARSINRIPTHLRILTGTYILQTNRAAFNQNEVDPTCLLCDAGHETTEHFILICPALESIRQTCFPEISQEYMQVTGNKFDRQSLNNKLKTLIDPSSVLPEKNNPHISYRKNIINSISNLTDLSRRYLYLIHCYRNRSLAHINSLKRKRRNRVRGHHRQGNR